MAGLVNYGSSDEEEDLQKDVGQEIEETNLGKVSHDANGGNEQARLNGDAPAEVRKHNHNGTPEVDAPLVGPVLGPTIPTAIPNALPDFLEEENPPAGSLPQSPYSANRALLRDLTLPTMPNYDIPASPPGSPLASSNSKFRHFLGLKKQGVHFNEKLARSAAMKNPSLMQKLLDFSDIDEAGQYSTTLPKNLWDPNAFPDYAYKEQLAKSQQKILKRKEEEKARGLRENVDFVPASTSGDLPNRTGTPVAGSKPIQKSAAERIMAGLDRGRSNSPQTQGVKRKTRFDS
ncbi:hypothetical protein G7Y89_g7477 [Cudoniella acicularis]|uniref:HCNGP-domain-containing protein n=1 Tax=Cudoniella acicularis TaxID=354080 RepID=A0A8H4W3S3_9HELO|nr:hypothetical protein G7Y89_g7477 [Cudoniella acicularis]